MTPHKHPICNDVLRAPADMPDCIDLHIRREGGCVWSFWQPNPEELAALVMGASVALAVHGVTHPPLSINVMHPPESGSRAVTPEESAAISDAVRGRFNALMKVTKKALAMLVQNTEATPERDRIVDRFLDIMTLNRGGNEVVRGVPADETATEQNSRVADLRAKIEAQAGKGDRWKDVLDWVLALPELNPPTP